MLHNDEIKSLIAERMEKGRKEYGQNSGYVWIQEALEEALDLSIYLSAKIIEIKNLRLDKAREKKTWILGPEKCLASSSPMSFTS